MDLAEDVGTQWDDPDMDFSGGNTSKLHHFVPKVLLRGFATEAERITAVRLPGDRRFTTSIGNVAAQTHFHRVDVEGQTPDAFERILSGVEGDAARIIRQVIAKGFPLSEVDRTALGYFVALQAVRGPDVRRSMAATTAQIARLEVGYGGRANVKDWVQRKFGRAVSDEQAERVWDEVMQQGGAAVTVSALTHIKQMILTAEQLLPYITGRPWGLHQFDRRSLVLSDTPVGLLPHADDGDDFGSGAGFKTAWGITVPLTRKVGLLMSDPLGVEGLEVEKVREGRYDRVQTGTTAMEKLFNENTILGAREWIYHHPDDARFLPDELPAPNPLSWEMIGDPIEFDGAPVFGGTTAYRSGEAT